MIIFDFDGVIIDSVDEVVVTAYNTATGEYAVSIEMLPPEYVRLFRKFRYIGRRAGDMPVLAKWCLEHIQTNYPNQEDSFTRDEFIRRLERFNEDVSEIGNRFFNARKIFVNSHRDAWLSLNHPYQPLWQELQKRDPQQIVVLTYKNQEAVLNLCHYYGLDVKAKNIYSGDHVLNKRALNKSENFLLIQERFSKDRYYFIDDALYNLLEFSHLPHPNIELLFASWGYVAPDDHLKAKEYGFPVHTQQSLIELIQTKHAC